MVAVAQIAEDRARSLDHGAAKRAFFRIMDAWDITDADARILLGQPSRATLYAWKKGEGGKLSHDTLERVSYLLGIYKALQLLFPSAPQADVWVQKPNAAFGGRTAMEHMLGGRVVDIAFVRQYLDFVRGTGSGL